ncbi:MAG: response regulator [Silicimonas sp.]|nr:response regulator [Silicimonas sp.]
MGESFAGIGSDRLVTDLKDYVPRAASLARLDAATGTLWVAVSVRLPPKEGELISSERGSLLVAYDYWVWESVASTYSQRNGFAAIGLLAVLSIVLLALLWVLVTRRIQRMTEAAEDMASGNLNRTIEVHGEDEIGRLGSSFESLTRQLANTISEYAASEKRLKSIMDSASDAIFLVAQDGQILLANNIADKLFGKAPDEQRNISSLLDTGEDVPFLDFAFSEEDKGRNGLIGGGEISLSARLADGTLTPVEVSMGRYAADEGLRFVLVVRDVSERQRLESQVRTMQRMDAVGQLTAGIAHDFNNLLAVSMGNLELLKDSDLDEAQQDLADAGIEACLRGANLARQLLVFGRKAELNPEVLNINAVVSDVRKLLQRAVPENIDIETSLSAKVWPTFLDRTQVESAILNLAINARDAMPEGGTLTIETENIRLDTEYALGHRLEISPGPYVMVAVTDTGHGIPPEDIDRVFEPFFTTKEVGKGSGMGLAMVFGLVKQSGGNAMIYSEMGVGTTVKLYFPRTERIDQKPQTVSADPKPSLGTETILLVEDDEGVRKTMARHLENLAYDVVLAVNGDDAVRQISEGLQFDLVLTDVVMDGAVQGPELAKIVLSEMPGLPVILMSGYPKGATENGNGQLAHLTMLTKPIQKMDLARAIRLEFSRLKR